MLLSSETLLGLRMTGIITQLQVVMCDNYLLSFCSQLIHPTS